MGKGLMLASVVAVISGCATAKGGFCVVSSPLRLSAAAVDALSDGEVKALLAHNRKGERLCRWKP
ncbi:MULTISPECIES: hypothetical protein [Mesorhizobium]|uniref:hypothetical protein n=1 Tax=Mesorhizobium TaxID=68287 RepID=UPI0003CF5827|nr:MULTISPECIES: hypothetical protein [unclassified Mesorhizobium]ESY86298.1 hypothetical protein X739_13945 [Mesorhizobium sp. LNHC220B00]ESY96999.1 hypothetical protein X741_00095 [Mesorhizobium sp. LNHC229A00]ESZ01841.1 hypothetical protein X738_03420 [Mesorhizobium sp. LNHC209A00]